MWEWLGSGTDEAAAELKDRLNAVDAGKSWDAVHALKLSHDVSPALQDLVCVCVCVCLCVRVGFS